MGGGGMIACPMELSVHNLQDKSPGKIDVMRKINLLNKFYFFLEYKG